MSEFGTITLIPSVHYSPVHRSRVRTTIRETDPDIVAVELGTERYDRLQMDSSLDACNLAHDLPESTAPTYQTLKALQQTVARLYGLDPGQSDMATAIDTAADLDIDVALIDNPISAPIEAISARVGLDTMPKMLLRTQSIGPREWVEQVELWMRPLGTITSGDDVQPAIDQLRRLLPEVARVLIDQRDRAMAHRLHRLRSEGADVVAVIGAGHHNGIKTVLDELTDQPVESDITVPIRSPSRDVTTIPIE
ncbi:TraB/GumN family protein [Halomicroarcula sp. GCM10025709]|uniref:TraB/GumN family protein n=1 Tax=Haloarcula TaxID=2237 RepID=UPI0024C3177B|nr:TraB/GumN family protein [Halomicroarcula sp. YJ-61-S]